MNSVNQNKKVMIIGLDGATFDLIEPWVQARHLPTFSRLMSEGAWGPVSSTIPPMTAPAWTSFMTGKNPGKHGLYDWTRRCRDSYQVYPVTASHCEEQTLWSLLSAAKLRVCVVNVPMTFPPTALNGLMISGMPAPSTRLTITFPSTLLAEIEREVGEYLLYPDPGQAYSDSGVQSFLDRLYRTTDTRLRVMEHLRAREDWDFFMLVFNGTDTVQHAMWKYMSPQHPLHDHTKLDRFGDAILHYYQYLDGALGEILADLDENTALMVMSDHGFGPFHKFIHVNNWLRQEGWLKIKEGPKARLKSVLFDLGLTPMQAYNLLMRVGMGVFKREVVRGRGQRLLKTLFLSFDDVDWPNTTAYSLGNVGQIHLNVRGREPQGCIEPGKNYEATRGEIMARLLELRDPHSGELVIESVYRREEVYQGPHLEEAADIVFIPTRMEYFGFGEYEFGSNKIIEGMERGISGTHRLNGILLLWGKPIQPGRRLDGARLVDLAPTLLHLMGQPIPSDMDGRVLSEALTPDYAGPWKIKRVLPTEDRSDQTVATDDNLSAEDTDLIVERLRGLGYVA
jgi:predicted AlkP superfamily phosphohydrolase/phosphomutase